MRVFPDALSADQRVDRFSDRLHAHPSSGGLDAVRQDANFLRPRQIIGIDVHHQAAFAHLVLHIVRQYDQFVPAGAAHGQFNGKPALGGKPAQRQVLHRRFQARNFIQFRAQDIHQLFLRQRPFVRRRRRHGTFTRIFEADEDDPAVGFPSLKSADGGEIISHLRPGGHDLFRFLETFAGKFDGRARVCFQSTQDHALVLRGDEFLVQDLEDPQRGREKNDRPDNDQPAMTQGKAQSLFISAGQSTKRVIHQTAEPGLVLPCL